MPYRIASDSRPIRKDGGLVNEVQLAWRNLWRNRRRSLLSMGGIVFAAGILVFMLSLQVNQYQLMLRAAVASGTGYLQAQAEGYFDDGRIWLVIPDPASVETELRAEPRVSRTTVRSEGFSLLASEEHAQGALIVGVRPEGERAITNVPGTVRKGAYLDAGDFDQAVFGALLARNLGVGVGDRVTVLGTARDGSVAAAEIVVKGIFESGQPEFDRGVVYVPLEFFDEVFRMHGAVHRVIAQADSLWGIDATARRLTASLAGSGMKDHPPVVLTWRQLLPGVLEGIKLDMLIGGVMYVILVLVVAFSILNTFIMAVFERTREFGVMMAIGTTPWRLVRVLLLESGFLTLIGVVAGIALGSAVTAYFARLGLYFGQEAADYMAQYGMPPRLHPELSLATAVFGPAIVFAVTMLAAWFPAVRIRRMRPVEAIRVA